MLTKVLATKPLGRREEFWRWFHTADGIVVVDSRQRIVHWSESVQRLLGYRPEEVVGKLCYEVLGGRDSRNYNFCRSNCPVVVNARRGRPTPNYDILCTALPGTQEKWLNVSIVITRRPSGPFRIIHLLRDVSRRRSTEEFARRASLALRELLGQENGQPSKDEESAPPPLPKLSRREMEVLRLLANGMSTHQIADCLTIRPVTARNHVARLLTKLGVGNRLQAVVYASQHHLI